MAFQLAESSATRHVYLRRLHRLRQLLINELCQDFLYNLQSANLPVLQQDAERFDRLLLDGVSLYLIRFVQELLQNKRGTLALRPLSLRLGEQYEL